MLTAYINAALRKARYAILPEDEGYFGAIEGLQGVWAQAEMLEACWEELREIMEEWMSLSGLLKMYQPYSFCSNYPLSSKKVWRNKPLYITLQRL